MQTEPFLRRMTLSTRISFGFIILLFVLVEWLHMATPLITVLFSYFALNLLSFRGRKLVGVTCFFILLVGISYGLYYFVKQAYVGLPNIAATTIPVVLEFAEKQGFELPFSDFASLKVVAVDTVRAKWAGLGKYAHVATVQIVSLAIGIFVAVSLFFNSRFELESDTKPGARDNLYSAVVHEIGQRFWTFYESFATVMGAQMVISAINTALTSVFLLWNGFPYTSVIVGLTFLFGLLPIIGNLMSNTLIVGVGFTISPKMALLALIFLVLLHKLEYFLNSKIIGERIRNPMWLTLLGLVIGERLMGIPGMILAPVVLHYVKTEMKRQRVAVGRRSDTGQADTLDAADG